MSISVCEHISGATRGIFTKFSSMLPIAEARSCLSRVAKSQGEGAVWGFSSLFTMHSNSFAANKTSCSSRMDHSVVAGG